MDRIAPRPLRPSPFREPAAALVAAPLDPQTYRNLGFLMLSVPLGLAYLAFLATGFGLIPGALSGASLRLATLGEPIAMTAALVCLAVGVLALPMMLPVLDAAHRLIGFERRLIRSHLGGSVAPATTIEFGGASVGPWRRLAARLTDVGFARGLTYLVVKGPLALLTFAVVAGSSLLILGLLMAPALSEVAVVADFYAAVGIDQAREAWLCVLIAFPVLGLALQAVNALAWVAHELAHLLLAPSSEARHDWATRSTTR
jgi:hypothetical protein